ncbi:hypothetical protein [Nocardioides limicola]|uniref:hypothetical protein n=1 Tax=Nocardioides limicola TaxID=2803368 RepID=UPI00193C5853|nr:hypothetical protein [Nocardioides sp. DJM-14]
MRRTAARLVALAVAATLLPAGAANAAEHTVRDARGDVVAVNPETDEQTPSDVANGDIVRARFIHGQRAFVLRAKFRSLDRKGSVVRGDFIRITTNDRVRRNVEVWAAPANWDGTAHFKRPNGDVVMCQISHRINYGKNTLTVRVPRTCLQNPRWIRVGFGSVWGDGSTLFMDDAQRNGTIKGKLALSPRIRRG